MSCYAVKSSGVNIDEGPATQIQIAQLLRSLELLPVMHLDKLPTIQIKVYKDKYAGGAADNDKKKGLFYIRISSLCWNSSWNKGLYNETLLHEVGHIIDAEYGCMTYLSKKEKIGYEALMKHKHVGKTQFPGEHYADAYKDFFLQKIDDKRRSALMKSPAFAGVGYFSNNK